MSIEEKKRRALDLFANGFNCAQSVLGVYANELNLNEQSAFKIASGFGGGMGGLQKVCGAVTGAFMVIGYLHGKHSDGDDEAKNQTNTLIKQFAKLFTKEHGELSCRGLIKYDLSNPEEETKANEEDVFNKLCTEYIKTSIDILNKILPDIP